MSRLYDWITRGTRAAQAAAAASNKGMLYFVTDEIKLERSSGSAWESMAANKVVQSVYFETGATATGTTKIPMDDTIPQSSEGDQYMAAPAITPNSALNLLKIDVSGVWSPDAANWVIAALFQDAVANAIAAMIGYQSQAGGVVVLNFTHWMVAGATSAMTFKVRAGQHTAAGTTLRFNGEGASRRMGGVMASSITVTELTP